jgi:TolB-like protein/Tfp pilus assembly protein PilF
VFNNEIETTLISVQLSKILLADVFQHSTILTRFLKFTVEETLAGHETELKEYTIAVKVLLKRTNFNPQLDPIVRIHAGRLRRALHEYYLEAGKNDPVIISIPKGSYIPAFATRSTAVDLPVVFNNMEFNPPKKTTIAVLPFRNISPDVATETFADGLGDRISTELTRYPELSVVSYYSCRNIISKTADIKEAALMLDAKYILTGSVQIDSTRLRITVQLVLGSTREQIWVNTYERVSNAANLFEIQDEIVWQVVSQTAGHYGAIYRNVSKIPPLEKVADLGIYDAIFWYYHFVNDNSEEVFHQAEAAMRKAVETDPGYALGWAVLGEVLVGGYFNSFKSRHVENQLELAISYGKKAIKIDPVCQHAYQTMALANLFLHNKAASLKAIEEWVKIKPGAAGIMGAMGFCLICCGQYERGFKMLDESVQLNPYYQWWYNGGISFYYFHKEDFTDTIYWAEKINMPNIPWELLMKTAALAEMNNLSEASQYCIILFQRFPFLQNVLESYLGAFLQDELLVAKLYKALLKAREAE